ncbi:hypothetical protein AAA074_15600 [Coprococcus comes]
MHLKELIMEKIFPRSAFHGMPVSRLGHFNLTFSAALYRFRFPESVRKKMDVLYSECPPEEEDALLQAIPYYNWCNRGKTHMKVWMQE